MRDQILLGNTLLAAALGGGKGICVTTAAWEASTSATGHTTYSLESTMEETSRRQRGVAVRSSCSLGGVSNNDEKEQELFVSPACIR